MPKPKRPSRKQIALFGCENLSPDELQLIKYKAMAMCLAGMVDDLLIRKRRYRDALDRISSGEKNPTKIARDALKF